MCLITLISTRHSNIGECNLGKLLQILENLQPEVIFEEMPPSYFDKYYIEKSRSKMETEAISKYLQTNNAIQVPVDTDDIPSETFFQNHKNALERVERLRDVNGFDYRNAVDNNKRYTAMYGFRYLNSQSSIDYNDTITDATRKGLEKVNDEKPSHAYNLWNEFNERREIEMLQNIYNYSEKNNYSSAVFLLGVGHRKSMIKKIKNHKYYREKKLNWVIYGDVTYSKISNLT